MNGEPGVHHHDLIEQRELLSAYLDGELSASEQQALARHLASCDTCGEQLDGLRQVRTLLRALPSPALPRSFTLPETGALPTATFRVTDRKRSRLRLARVTQWAGGVAAAAGIALMIGSAMLTRGPMTATSTASNAYAPAAGAAHAPAATPTTSQDQLTGKGSAGGAATPNATAHLYDRSTATPAPFADNNTSLRASETASTGQTVQELLPYAGIGLASGGLLLLVGGSVSARRQRP